MRRPSEPKDREALEEAFAYLRSNMYFERFIEWVRRERNQRDAENRWPGKENQTSESQALSIILDLYDEASKK